MGDKILLFCHAASVVQLWHTLQRAYNTHSPFPHTHTHTLLVNSHTPAISLFYLSPNKKGISEQTVRLYKIEKQGNKTNCSQASDSPSEDKSRIH